MTAKVGTVAAALGAALIALMTACSTSTEGAATTVSNTTSSTTTSAGRATSTKASSGTSPTAQLDPCDLLTDAGKAQLGLSGPGRPDHTGSGRSCVWQLRGPQDTYIFGVELNDKYGLKDIPADADNKEVPDVGGRKALQTDLGKNTGACSVNVFVTEKSRAAATVVAGADLTKACQLARQTVELMEPQLPQ